MKLSRATAQKIVEEMMDVITYNINVMDENGIIIGSGALGRIGTFHDGAREAIDSKRINEVYHEGEGMKPGVSEPIIINGSVIGVIGITGYPDEVRRFSKLVRATAVLLIEQSKMDEEIQDRRLNMQKFYHGLAHRKIAYDEEFLERAKGYGLALTKKYQAVLVDGDVNSKTFKILYQQHTHYCELENNRTVFFISSSYKYTALLKDLKESKEINKVGVGGEEAIVAVSLENAAAAIKFGIRIKPSVKIYEYENLKFFINLSSDYQEPLISVFSNLDKSRNKLELIDTLQVYIDENGDINNVASRLNIHRNTLNYRIERIQQLTEKNPKILLELFELLCGLIWR
jgi:carbohydrate diacid regulator